MRAALLVTDFPLQAIARTRTGDERDDEALWAVVERPDYSGGTALLCLSDSAYDAGLRPGMTVAQARALVGDLSIEPRQPPLEASALQALEDVALSFAPAVVLKRSAVEVWAYLDVSGLEQLVGTAHDIAFALRHGARKVGLEI